MANCLIFRTWPVYVYFWYKSLALHKSALGIYRVVQNRPHSDSFLDIMSQVRRSTVNIIVGTFLVMDFYLTYVQYANTTLGPYSRTALHHTPLRTLLSICDARTFLSLSLTCGPQTART